MAIKECYNTQNIPLTVYSEEKPALNIDLTACSKEERPRMISIVNRLAKSQQGEEALRIAAEKGYRFGFMSDSRNANGVTNFFAKRILLNPHRTDDKLVGTLCHECRHAVQNDRSSVLKDEKRWDIKSNLLYNRAMEADAQVCAVVACKELEDLGDAKPYMEFKEKYPEIETAFNQAYIAAGNKITHEVMTKAFEGWYDQDRIKTLYEQGYILRPLSDDLKWMKKKANGNPFDRSVSAEQTIKEITQTKDGNYFTDDPAILNGGKYMAVAENTMKQMQNYISSRHYLKKGDKSEILTGIPTRPDVPVPNMTKISIPNLKEKNAEKQASQIALMQKMSKGR